MIKILSILLIAGMVVFMACSNGSKKDIEKTKADSTRKADSVTKINDSIIKVKVAESLRKVKIADSLKKDSMNKNVNEEIVGLPCFIGMTKLQVKNYWSTKISDECFNDGKNLFQILSFTCMQDGSNGSFAGSPDFTANFDNISGKCTYHSTKFSVLDISIYRAKLIQAGYVVNASLDGFVNKHKTILWKFEPAVRWGNGETTDVYFINCKSIK